VRPGVSVLCICWILLTCPAGFAATWRVPLQCPTIQAGIDSASAGDTVLVACGTYYEHDIVMKSGISLCSETGHWGCVTIDAEENGRVMFLEDLEGPEIIEGFTLTGGKVDASSLPPYKGAGLCCYNSSPSVRYCKFAENTAGGTYGSGGGMACHEGSRPSLHGCLFSDNGAVDGGGLACYGISSAVLVECSFEGNHVGHPLGGGGAAMCCIGGSAMLTDCTFLNNVNSGGDGGGVLCWSVQLSLTRCFFSDNGDPYGDNWFGGAISCYECSLDVSDCVLLDNSAGRGGGMQCESCSGSFDGCVFAGNVASGGGWEGGGGAMYCRSSSLTVTGCTLYANSSPSWTSGISCEYGTSLVAEECIIASGVGVTTLWCYWDSQMTLTCCNVYGNQGGDWAHCVADQYGINGNISADPFFCDPENDDFTIAEDSPCAAGNHPDGYPCSLIGALDVGCDPSRTERRTWGGVKALYR